MLDSLLRVGAVSYLNTRPLIFGLRERLDGIGSLSLNLPSRLADELATGVLDVALIPSIEYFRGLDRGYRILSNAAITCCGPVWSVRLLCRVPVHQVRTLALDVGSRTSAGLAQVLLRLAHGITPTTIPLGMEQLPEACNADAVLVIGDRAMHPPAGVYQEIIDLGQWWYELTGLPFVFAMWVARDKIDPRIVEPALLAARDEGMRHLPEIAAKEAGPHGLTTSDLLRYFEQNLHFTLGPDQWEGLRAYHQGLIDCGLLPVSRAGSPSS